MVKLLIHIVALPGCIFSLPAFPSTIALFGIYSSHILDCQPQSLQSFADLAAVVIAI